MVEAADWYTTGFSNVVVKPSVMPTCQQKYGKHNLSNAACVFACARQHSATFFQPLKADGTSSMNFRYAPRPLSRMLKVAISTNDRRLSRCFAIIARTASTQPDPCFFGNR